jgi:single-strand DNA-binding protein
MNEVVLIGRLARDPEVRSTSSGSNTARFSIAVNRRFKNKDGQYDADFISCVACGNNADFISKFFKKGNLICIEGRIQTGSYDAQDGTKRYTTDVAVDNVEFVGGRNEGGAMPSNNSFMDMPSNAPIDVMPEYDIPASDPYENYDKEVSLSDNDLPF